MLPYYAAQYVADNFGKTWQHFDVNGEGKIHAEMVPQFFRLMAGPLYDTFDFTKDDKK